MTSVFIYCMEARTGCEADGRELWSSTASPGRWHRACGSHTVVWGPGGAGQRECKHCLLTSFPLGGPELQLKTIKLAFVTSYLSVASLETLDGDVCSKQALVNEAIAEELICSIWVMGATKCACLVCHLLLLGSSREVSLWAGTLEVDSQHFLQLS